MCQAASSSPTEHVQNRPPALHVRRGYARDVRRDELVQLPEGRECNFNHLFFFHPSGCFCYRPHCVSSLLSRWRWRRCSIDSFTWRPGFRVARAVTSSLISQSETYPESGNWAEPCSLQSKLFPVRVFFFYILTIKDAENEGGAECVSD